MNRANIIRIVIVFYEGFGNGNGIESISFYIKLDPNSFYMLNKPCVCDFTKYRKIEFIWSHKVIQIIADLVQDV